MVTYHPKLTEKGGGIKNVNWKFSLLHSGKKRLAENGENTRIWMIELYRMTSGGKDQYEAYFGFDVVDNKFVFTRRFLYLCVHPAIFFNFSDAGE